MTRPRREPPEASSLLEALQASLYPEDDWGFLTEVRSTTGAASDLGVLRYADALAIKFAPPVGWEIDGIEVKRSLADLDAELRHPEKSAPFRLFCRRWWLCFPTLIRAGVLDRFDRIPQAWGLLEAAARDELHAYLAQIQRRLEQEARGAA